MTAWACPICDGQGCSAKYPCTLNRHFEVSGYGPPQNAATSPVTPHGTSEESKAPPDRQSVAALGERWYDDVIKADFEALEKRVAHLVADNRALTDQVTRLQADSTARLMLTRIRRVLLLGDEVPDHGVVDEVDKMAKRASNGRMISGSQEG